MCRLWLRVTMELPAGPLSSTEGAGDDKVFKIMDMVQELMNQQACYQAQLTRIDGHVMNTAESVLDLQGAAGRHDETIQIVDRNLRTSSTRRWRTILRLSA